MILGSVDDVSVKGVVGWVHSTLSRDILKVQATINNRVIGEAAADIYRPDLAQAGLGTGHCGFDIRFEHSIEVAYLPFLEIRPAGGTLVLPRTSTAGFTDYFSWLYKKYPSVGRYASLLGGLWTDRSDAMALLKARTDIGTVRQDDSGMLSRFINEGIVLVDLDVNSERGSLRPSSGKASGKKPLATEIASRFFHEPTLRLLRSILEDHPIAVKAEKRVRNEQSYTQFSAWEDLPAPAECLGLIMPMTDSISVEVLRSSHRFPEFSADGISRWTPEGVGVAADAGAGSSTFTDQFSIVAGGMAIVGPGLLHRVQASESHSAIRVLLVSAKHGSMRFRQGAPSDELVHKSGARL